MFSRTPRFFFLISLGVSFASCSYRVEKNSDLDGEIRPSAELISRVSFNDVYTRVLQPKCISCHGISGGINLETYANAKTFLPRIHWSTVIERRMPMAPVPALNREELELVAAWVEAGGPEFPLNGVPTEPVSPLPVLEPTFASIKELIVDRKCLQCHSSGGKAERIPLTKLDDFLDSPLEIVLPGNADESGLVLVLLEGARKKMPPPETGMAPLSSQEIEVIKEWINGLLESSPPTNPSVPPGDAPRVPHPEEPNPPESPELPHRDPRDQPEQPPEQPREPPVPLKPSFSSLKSVILDKKCMSCHSVGGKAERIPLNRLSDLTESPLEIVVPGNPEESGLALVLREGARRKMPPPDSGLQPVSKREIEIIEEWIRNGATN